MATPATTLISWHTHEYEKKDRHPDWPWYVGLLFGLAAVLAFFLGNIFFGIFLVLAGAMVLLYARKDPQHLSIEITDQGVTINGESIAYKEIRQFWLDETDKQDKLLLLVRKSFMPLLSFPLEGVTRDQVHSALTGKIPEVEMHESVSIKIFDRIGF